MNSAPLVLRSCMAVVFLLLLLEYAFRWGSRPKRKSGPCGKVRYSALGGSSVHSREARGRGTMSVDSRVSLLLQVCVVVLALLLMAGDIERNPGPTDKKGSFIKFLQYLISSILNKNNRVSYVYLSRNLPPVIGISCLVPQFL